MVVGGGAAITHLAASQTLMHDYLFDIAAEGRADRFHQAAAIVLPVARCAIHMFRIQTERAMIPMPSTADRRPDEGLAMTALELFGFRLPARRRPVGPFRPSMRRAAASRARLIIRVVVDPIVPRSSS
jgi:hypothetical protein